MLYGHRKTNWLTRRSIAVRCTSRYYVSKALRKENITTIPEKPVSKPNESVTSPPHIPVLLNETIEALKIKGPGIYIDATFGAGGHSSKILELLASHSNGPSNSKLFGIDRDPNALKYAQPLKERYGSLFIPVHARFSQMEQVLTRNYGLQPGSVDGIMFDIGVSSMQIDSAQRGFSYRPENDGPLDMRMDPTEKIPTAADIVNRASISELANILFKNANEHASTAIAKEIVRARTKKPIRTTLELHNIVSKVVKRKLPSQLTFQALRIAVNDELNELKSGLLAAERLLKPGGRLVVITFHSIERRIVKDFLRLCSGVPLKQSPIESAAKIQQTTRNPSFEVVNKKAVKSSAEEEEQNSRSKPAQLISAIRTRYPPLSPDLSSI